MANVTSKSNYVIYIFINQKEIFHHSITKKTFAEIIKISSVKKQSTEH